MNKKVLILGLVFLVRYAQAQWSIGFDFGFSTFRKKQPPPPPPSSQPPSTPSSTNNSVVPELPPPPPPPPPIEPVNVSSVEGDKGYYKNYFKELMPSSPLLGLVNGLGASVAMSGDGQTVLAGAPNSFGPTEGLDGIYSGAAIDSRKGKDGIWYLGPPLANSNYLDGKVIKESFNRHFGFSVDVNQDGSVYAVSADSCKSYGLNKCLFVIKKDRSCGSQDVNSKCNYKLVAGPFSGGIVSLSDSGNSFATANVDENGATGKVWIYTSNGSWDTPIVTHLENRSGSSSFGASVAMSGDGNTVIIGGPADDSGVGAAWIFVRNSSNLWTLDQKIVGTQSIGKAKQGTSVSINRNGNTVIVGGPDDNNKIGASWIFVKNNMGRWIQQQKLVGSEYIGQSLQGASVSMSSDGKTIIMGAPGNDSNYGRVWVFTFNEAQKKWDDKDGFTFKNEYLTPGKRPDGRVVEPPEFGKNVSLSDDGRTAILGSGSVYAGYGVIYVVTFKIN